MSDPNQGQDPSMEDILASIRRIIDEDDKKAVPGARPVPPVEPDDDEVLDLTEVVDTADDQEFHHAAPEPDAADWGEGDATLPDETAEVVPEPEPEPVPSYTAPEVTMNTSADNRLISDTARSSAAAALGSLARAVDRDPLAGVPKGRPVEDLVLELLRPMLREWLDQNLPAIVERIVEREVRYLSRRLEDDRT